MVSMAADFQQGITRLQTGAGESADNLALVSKGILDMAGQVGESTKDLASGMYLIESAGFHGAEGLKVLQLAAEGARVGNADMATVANAVTTGLNAYHLGADKAAQVTNALIAAEGQGKTTMEDLASSISTVAPAASIAGISFEEMLAAMATMTAMGTSSANAATYLRQTILQLSNPTQKARAEMESLGLDATQVSMNLGKNGLAATLTELTDAIQAHMGPAGTVLIQKLKGAAGSADTFQQILADLPPEQQTFIGALADMVGGTKSMQAALELTGPSMQVFMHNTEVIKDKVAAGGDTIENWSLVQQNFNTQMAEAKGKLEAVGIEIGTKLMPYAGMLVGQFVALVDWLGRHNDVLKTAAELIGVFMAAYAVSKIIAIVKGIGMAVEALGAWTKAQLALNIAMDANVIGLIVIGIAALAIGFLYLWNHSEAFRQFWIGLWHDSAAVVMWVWHSVLEPFFQGVGEVVSFFVHRIVLSEFNLIAWAFMELIGKPALALWHGILEPAFHGIGEAVMWLWHVAIEPASHGIAVAFRWMFEGLAATASAEFHQVVGVLKEALNFIIGMINSAFDGVNHIIRAVDKVPGVDFPTLPMLPQLAVGGRAIGSGLAVVGEQGAEVVRLGAGDTVYPHGSMPALGGDRGGSTQVVVSVDPSAPQAPLIEALVKALRFDIRTNGGGNVQTHLGYNAR